MGNGEGWHRELRTTSTVCTEWGLFGVLWLCFCCLAFALIDCNSNLGERRAEEETITYHFVPRWSQLFIYAINQQSFIICSFHILNARTTAWYLYALGKYSIHSSTTNRQSWPILYALAKTCFSMYQTWLATLELWQVFPVSSSWSLFQANGSSVSHLSSSQIKSNQSGSFFLRLFDAHTAAYSCILKKQIFWKCSSIDISLLIRSRFTWWNGC